MELTILPATRIPVPVHGYAIKKYKELETHRGVAYTCELTLDGKVIASIENRGDGGMTWTHFTSRELQETFNAWAMSIPGRWSEEYNLEWNPEGALETLITESQMAGTLSRRKNICFITTEEDPAQGVFRTAKMTEIIPAAQYLAKRFNATTTCVWTGKAWVSLADILHVTHDDTDNTPPGGKGNG